MQFLINNEKCIRNPESAECLRTSPIVEIALSRCIMLMNAVCFGKDPPEERTPALAMCIRAHREHSHARGGHIVWSPGL